MHCYAGAHFNYLPLHHTALSLRLFTWIYCTVVIDHLFVQHHRSLFDFLLALQTEIQLKNELLL